MNSINKFTDNNIYIKIFDVLYKKSFKFKKEVIIYRFLINKSYTWTNNAQSVKLIIISKFGDNNEKKNEWYNKRRHPEILIQLGNCSN